jgi:light-regulated signal transduction histidine kinase (bacteriophytochrome)
VQERTAELAESTRRLEVVNQELEAFSYSVSHDLRAPLRHVTGFSDLLQRQYASALDERGRHYLDTIGQAARKMGQLIDDLLVFSRMGRVALCRVPVPLDALVQEAIRDLASEVKDRQVTWVIGELPVLQVDRSVLRLVFANLLGNALKYTRPRAEARIEVGHRVEGQEDVIYVRDNGVGFDMQYVGKLFGVFQRLHSEKEFEGTGIGLANVRRIVQRHGGRTWAEGRPGEGAVFFFSIAREAAGKGEVHVDAA